MLLVVERGREAEVAAVFERWDLRAVVVGTVAEGGMLEVLDRGHAVAVLPVELLARGAPVRRLESRPEERPRLDLDRVPRESPDLGGILLRLLTSPNLGSRRPVFRRYDHMVGNATLIPPGGDAALLRIVGTQMALAMTTDGNARYCHLDPYSGSQIAVAEAARNIVATGARPVGVTDCLNFGNPERPEVYWELEEAVAGLGAACRAFDLPVVSGNVSLYNESENGSIHPTPVVGMLGVLDDYARRLEPGLRDEGDFVLVVGSTRNELGGSEYLEREFGVVAGPPPAVDLAGERGVQEFVLAACGSGLLRSAHDVAEGGMLVALAETCLWGGLGVRCPELRADEVRLDAAFFGESQGRFIVSAGSRAMPELQSLARRHHVELQLLGMAGGQTLEFEGQLSVTLDEIRSAYDSALLVEEPA
jgi:phosphoribosylformylglycinamidine synthase